MTKVLKIIVSSLVLIALSGCFGGGSNQIEVPANYKVYSTDLYNFQYYTDWEILGPENLADYPRGTLLALRNNVKEKDKFITNFTITRNPVSIGMDSINYGLQVKSQHNKNLINFSIENEEKITTKLAGEDIPSLYIVFTGKLRPQGDTLRFFQKFVVKEDQGYILTITSALNEEELTLEKAKNTMKSFNLN